MSLLLVAALLPQLPFVAPPGSRSSMGSTPRSGGNTRIVKRDECGRDDLDYYCDIWEALKDAEDGDTILVYGDTYSYFELSKSVTICAMDHRITVKGFDVHSIHGTAVVSGFDVINRDVSITDCPGTVVLESIDLLHVPRTRQVPAVEVRNCSHVILEDLWIPKPPNRESWPEGAIRILDSFVRLEHSHVEAGDGADGNFDCVPYAHGGSRGESGVYAKNSSLYVSHCTLIGGSGGHSGGEDCFLFEDYDAGDGGSGIQIADSELMVLGSEADLVIGGSGGDEVGFYTSCAGSGGDGVQLLDDRSVAVVSRVTAVGGAAGKNGESWCDTREGVGLFGNVERFDELATLTVEGPAVLGESLPFSLDSVHSGRAILVATGAATIERWSGFLGPPSALDFHSFWLIWPLGATDSQGDLHSSLQIPFDPRLAGTFAVLQALICTNGGDFVTNAVPRVVTTRRD